MSSRTWVKIYCDKWLEGTISEESIQLRGIWVTLLALAGNGKYGDSGEIKALEGVGFNDKQLAAMLKVSVNLWVAAKKQLIKTDRIIEQLPKSDAKKEGQLQKEGGKKAGQLPLVIAIANWNKYQSEYERTSKYRTKSTTNATTDDTGGEDRGENRENNIKENQRVHGQFKNVFLTEPELTKLQERWPAGTRPMDYQDRIEELSEAMQSKPALAKRYKSHYATILSWSRIVRPGQSPKDHVENNYRRH